MVEETKQSRLETWSRKIPDVTMERVDLYYLNPTEEAVFVPEASPWLPCYTEGLVLESNPALIGWQDGRGGSIEAQSQ